MLEVRLVGVDTCRRYRHVRELVLDEAARTAIEIALVEETEIDAILKYRTVNLPLLIIGGENVAQGNPVSALMSFEIFGRPALLKMQGRTRLDKPTIEATLVDGIKRKDNRRHFVRVKLETRGGETFARLTGDQGSGILLSMVRADGIAILPEEWKSVEAGTRVRVMMLDWAEV